MRKLFSVLAIGTVLTLLVAGSARAQLPGTTIRASIPFDFIVRGRTLPAGKYEISRVNDESIDLLIRSVDHKAEHAMFETEPVYVGSTSGKDVLVFHRYGDSYYLSEVVTAGEETGREIAPSHAERQMQREMARNQTQPETVTLALN